MRISDWSSDVCSSDLIALRCDNGFRCPTPRTRRPELFLERAFPVRYPEGPGLQAPAPPSWTAKTGVGVRNDTVDVSVRLDLLTGQAAVERASDLGGHQHLDCGVIGDGQHPEIAQTRGRSPVGRE